MAKTKAKNNTNQLRIIGGKWRGRKLAIADVEGLRPTGDRIRETLFNWLSGHIVDSHCLDLFSGSGALGMECLSRGAAKVTLVEKNALAALQLRQHCQELDVTNGAVIETDVLIWLAQHSLTTPADIAFIDPPFDANLWASVIDRLEISNALSPTAILYIETPRNHLLSTPAHWTLLKEKQTGQVCYRLFQRQKP
ncbi:MAG: 16S rRNA (guanine966-N2)-methyltransferase [Candidatus Endobugula sp.]|jgi:16S rRNA (guanine966-N2)-methyltransferase